MSMELELYSLKSDPSVKSPIGHFTESLGGMTYRHRRSHELLILSCYIRKEALLSLIDRVAGEVRLSRVVVLFDVGEAVARGYRSIRNEFRAIAISLSKRTPSIRLDWSAIHTPGGLMHGKGYAVIQNDGKGEFAAGRLLLGSANATKRGLGLAVSPNVELGAVTGDADVIVDFEHAFWMLSETSRFDLSEAISAKDEQLFRYAILANGVYLIPWGGNVRSMFSLRFRLTEKGAMEALAPGEELTRRGLAITRGTLSKVYLSLPPDLDRRDFPPVFTRNCTIETGLGRFCPMPIWELVEERLRERSSAITTALQACLSDDVLDAAVAAAREDHSFLKNRGWCDQDDGLLEKWKERMQRLRESPDRILRILSQFNDIRLPYDRTDVEEIDDLFATIEDSLVMSRRENMAQRMISEMLERGEVPGEQLGSAGKDFIIRMFDAPIGS